MRNVVDVTCDRCGCTASGEGVDPGDLVAGHVCPDGEPSESFHVRSRRVPGPGERLSDTEPGWGTT